MSIWGTNPSNHAGIRFPNREFVSADRDLDRITEGRDFTDMYLRAFGDAHVRDAAFHRALSVELDYSDRLTDPRLPERLHCSYPPYTSKSILTA